MAQNWPIQRIGSRGENFRTIQYLLRHHGFPVRVDRIFGPRTQEAVRRFQRDRGLGVDGIVGNQTWPALIVLVASGSRGDPVRAVQRQLNARTSSLAVDGRDPGFALATAPTAGPTIRRNIAKVSQAERDKLRNAILELDRRTYPDGVSFWDKQDQIHQATHVHGGPAFIPWHRELINRYEALLKQIDPTVALHYWDWQTDPRSSPDGAGGTVNLFSTGADGFMGSASGRAGPPLDGFDNGGSFPGSRDDTRNPADPPREIRRNIGAGAPALDPDATVLAAGNGL